MVLPYGNTNATPMGSSVKKWVKWTRIVQLVLRYIESLAAVGLLVMMILIRGVDVSTGWILRITVSCAITWVTSAVTDITSPVLRFYTQSMGYII